MGNVGLTGHSSLGNGPLPQNPSFIFCAFFVSFQSLCNFIALLFFQFISCFKVLCENHIFYVKVSSIKVMIIIIISVRSWQTLKHPRVLLNFSKSNAAAQAKQLYSVIWQASINKSVLGLFDIAVDCLTVSPEVSFK